MAIIYLFICPRTSHHSSRFCSVAGGEWGSHTYIWNVSACLKQGGEGLRLVAHPQLCVCPGASSSYTTWWWGRERGRKHLPHPSVQQRGYVPVKSHHKPGHRHARANRPDPEVSHLLWSCCQNLYLPSRPPLYTTLPRWAQACWCLTPSSSGSKKRKRASEGEFFVCMCCRFCSSCMFSNNVGFFLTEVSSYQEISFKFKWHDGRLSSAHQQASLLVEKKKKKGL